MCNRCSKEVAACLRKLHQKPPEQAYLFALNALVQSRNIYPNLPCSRFCEPIKIILDRIHDLNPTTIESE